MLNWKHKTYHPKSIRSVGVNASLFTNTTQTPDTTPTLSPSPQSLSTMRRRFDSLLLLLLLFLTHSHTSRAANATCPYDFDAASRMIHPSCYANATAPSTTGCCWFVYAAYLYAAISHTNLTGEAFLPAAATSACVAAFPALLLRRRLVLPSLLSNGTCTLRSDTVALAAGSAPCLYPTVSDINSAVNLSTPTLLCTSPAVNLSTSQTSCANCQRAVTTAVFSLLNLTNSKEIVPCGMASTIGIWSVVPDIHRFQSYVLCLVQVLENIGSLSTFNLIPGPTPPVAAADTSSSGRAGKIAAGSAAAVAVVASAIAIIFLSLDIKKRRRRSTAVTTIGADWVAADGPQLPTEGLYIFTNKELKQATENYNEKLILGEGGAGKVYLGRLPSGHQVAIKRIYRERKLSEFYAEIRILAKLRHRNLTTLVGYCLDRKVHVLVYEYMAGGNLARALHAGELPWWRRVAIATDVAEGLAYLHEFSEGAVVHRDVKPTNVLLPAGDSGLPAKLSDFGVSRMMPTEATHMSTEVRGTMGYVDPDSFHIGHVSETADVYSFGVMLLELVTGMKAVVPTPSGGAESIVHAARGAMTAAVEDGVGAIVDPRLGEGWDRSTVGAVFELACRCVRPYKEERPTMVEVLAVLKTAAAALEGRVPAPAEEVSEEFSDALTSTSESTRSIHARSL